MRWTTIAAILLVVTTALVGASLPNGPAVAQDDAEERIAALETQVTEQEERLSRLEEAIGTSAGGEEEDPFADRDDEDAPEIPSNTLPLGDEGRISGWLIEVREVNFDATDVIHEENEFVDPPSPGNRFVLIRLGATYAIPGEGQLAFDVDFAAVAESGNSYGVFDNCGFIPERLDTAKRISGGGTLVGNICYEVAEDDVDSLVLFVKPGSIFAEGAGLWFSLHEG